METKKEITTDELERLYKENTVEQAARKLGVSVTTLMRYIDKAGIERKGGNRPKFEVV